jgi:hypothetical protein
VGDSVGDSVGVSVRDSVGDSGYGSHDANWLGFYDFFRQELGLINQTEKLQGLTELAKNGGWFLPHAEICWVSERHSVLQRDTRGRLHSLTDAAVSYPDGWKIYAVHGVRVPEYVILNPEKITIEIIEKENNSEIKRIMIDRFGQDRYLKESGATLINTDQYGKLYRKEIENDEPLVMVNVINSTKEADGTSKEYWIRVPPDIKTSREAVSWTFGIKGNDYSPIIET